MTAKSEARPIRVGVSSCLLGEEVRYDGGHKHDVYLNHVLSEYFSFVAVCPELETGMGVPREAVHLAGEPAAPRMLGNSSGIDWTDRMNRYARKRVKQLARMDLSGYILKSRSPSCGMARVKVTYPRNAKARAHPVGSGLFAAELMRQLPLLPVEEEGRLNDPGLRDNFVVRVFAYHRLRGLFAGRFSRGAVVAFHSGEKYLLMAHSPKHFKQLGQLVVHIKEHKPAAFRDTYCRLYMEALALKSTTKKNVNVLQHIVGYLKDKIGVREKRDILAAIEDYRQELVPLIVPLTLIKHYLQLHEIANMREQIYLHPHSTELMLRNHV